MTASEQARAKFEAYRARLRAERALTPEQRQTAVRERYATELVLAKHSVKRRGCACPHLGRFVQRIELTEEQGVRVVVARCDICEHVWGELRCEPIESPRGDF